MMKKLLLGLMIGSIALPVLAQPANPGVEAWQKGNAAGAVVFWRPLAEKGDADAAFYLGQAYMVGKGVPLDLAKAQDWLGRAAQLGHVSAQATLGLLLVKNGHRSSAMPWLARAAAAGEPRALLMLGTAAYLGDGVPKDEVTAYAFISRAAAMGLPAAKATLADLDSRMPLAQRKQGVALAMQMASPRKGAAPKPASPQPAGRALASSAATAAKPAAAPAPARLAAAPAPVRAAPAASSGGWRIQLGAFGQRKSAETLFAGLSARLAGKQPYYIPFGAVIRLQSGPFESRAAATAACAKLAPQPCFAVAGK